LRIRRSSAGGSRGSTGDSYRPDYEHQCND
jgi:hypothetical protein